MNTNTTVIIVGKGISGLILSTLLKEKEIDHILLDRTEKRKSIALSETLPPSTLPLLASLNLLELFEESSSRSFGYHSLWGTENIAANNFFFHTPFKYGLKLDKQKLLKALSIEKKEIVLNFDSIMSIKQSTQSIEVKITQNKTINTITGKIIIDATGRNRAVLKRFNLSSQSHDQLIASTCHIPLKKHPALKHKVFVESFKQGWGIVSSLNEQTNVMTIYTQKGNPILKQLKDYSNWENVLSETKLLAYFLTNDTSIKVIGGDANSSRASKISGENWLSIGDAAIAFDPLSSHGISNVIYTAKMASEAIQLHLRKEKNAFKAYEQNLTQIFNAYLKQKSDLYLSEKRWRTSSFWSSFQKRNQTTYI